MLDDRDYLETFECLECQSSKIPFICIVPLEYLRTTL